MNWQYVMEKSKGEQTMTDESDDVLASLIARTSLKDQRAFKELYDATSSYLNGIAYRILGNAALSEEALQETYLQVWKNAHRFRPNKARAMTWLISITRYRALDKLAKITKACEQPLDSISDKVIKAPLEPDNVYQQWQMNQSFLRCFEQLESYQATCLKMAYLEGHSREAIATAMAAKVNTVKSWLRRAQEKLKSCLMQ